MELELVAEPARGGRRRPALLFLHGICSNAAIWRPFFLPAFAAAGYDSYALSLRGHGRSAGRERLGVTTLSDYVEDLRATLARLARPTVVVGFSLGGAVLQASLPRAPNLAGAVLLAAVPPYGLASAGLRLLFRDAWAWQSLVTANQWGLRHADAESIARTIFTERVSPQVHADFLAGADEESPLVGLQLQGWPPFAPLPWQLADLPPLLVMGGGADRLVPPEEVRATAAYYGQEALVLPELPHMLMLEPEWRQPVAALLDWLERLPDCL